MDFQIKNLKQFTQFGSHGWEWDIVSDDPYAQNLTGAWRTNRAGDGLWHYNERGEAKQFTGTSQFMLTRNNREANRKRIRRYFEKLF